MELVPILKLLGDENRLRLLALLAEEELSVQEIVSITGMGQPRVSHHLGLLRGAGLVRDRKEGGWTFYRLRPPGVNGSPLDLGLWSAVSAGFRDGETARRDREERERIVEARREMSRSAHDRLAGVWRMVGQNLERGSLRSEALSALVSPDLTVADLGCGAGFFTAALARRVGRVIAVDHSRAMLDEARKTLDSCPNVEYRRGEMESLPLADGEVDAVVSNLVLHHLSDLRRVAAEIGRVLEPGGVAVVTDLRPHRESWMREELGDLRLGIDPDEVRAAFEAGPFESLEEREVEDRYQLKSPSGRIARLELFLIRAVKKA